MSQILFAFVYIQLIMVVVAFAYRMQRRIAYRGGVWVLEGCDGQKFGSIHELLAVVTQARRPAKDRVNAVIEGKPLDGKSTKSPREILEDAMTFAEQGDFKAAYDALSDAIEAGASERNSLVSREYINSLAAAAGVAPPPPENVAF